MRKRSQIEIVISTIIIIGLIGTLSYHQLEGWGYVDSFYFTGITMMTIGYGDLHPTTPLSKIFTVFFGFFGVGICILALSLIASSYIEGREKALLGKPLQKKFRERLKNSEIARKRRKKEIIEGSRV